MPIDFRVRDFLAPLAIQELSRTFDRLQWADPDEVRAYQVKRLRIVLGHAGRLVPHFVELFARSGFDPRSLQHPDDLQCLPLLTKDALRDDPESLIAKGASRRAHHWHSTSGTSGRPLRVLLDRRANALEFCYFKRAWGWAGYRLGLPFVELGGHHFLTRGRDPDRLLHWQPMLQRLMVNTNRLSAARMPELRSALASHQPRFVKGLPSALEHLTRCMEEEGGGSFAFQAAFSGGEVVTSWARARVETAFECKLFDSYGQMERTVAISQCEEGRYHVHDDYGMLERRSIECLEGGRRVALVAGTGLHNLAMPLLRYDVGDRIELVDDGECCKCGRGLSMVAAIHGRVVDVIKTPDGRVLSTLATAFDSVPGIETLQLVQVAQDVLELRMVPAGDWSEVSQDELMGIAQRALGKGMTIALTIARHADLVRGPGGKARPVVGLPTQQEARPRDGELG